MKDRHILTEEDKKAISNEIASVEKVTSGEIVPVVANRSSRYRTAELIAAILFGYVFVFFSYEFLPWRGILYVMITDFIGIIIALTFMHIDVLKRIVISKHVMDKKVHHAALSAFYHYGLHNTKGKTGILIYVSVFERKVVVMGDKGINTKVKDSDWDDVVSKIIDGIRHKRVGQGIINGIEACRVLLKTHCPVTDSGDNELSDDVIEEDNE